VEDRRRPQDERIRLVQVAGVEERDHLQRVLDRVGRAVARRVEVGPVLPQSAQPWEIGEQIRFDLLPARRKRRVVRR
jgi:hypothetical protein